MSDRAFTVASLTDHWDCSEGVIRKLIARGKLEAFYLGTTIRIKREAVERCETTATQSERQ